MSVKLSVVIPYFQRQPGVLARTLNAVFKQTAPVDLQVVLVDDESPIPAESECSGLSPEHRQRILLLRQANAGAAAARNRALNAVHPRTRYVALLDSDDVWSPDHLSKALTCLEAGCDFFFSDHRRIGDTQTHFEIAKFDWRTHPTIDADRQLHRFAGDLFSTVLRHSPIGTSTVVFDWKKFRRLRFAEDLRVCEDLLFWLDVAHAGCSVGFGAAVQVTYTEGVNIYGGVRWASQQALKNERAFAMYYQRVARRFPLRPDQMALVKERRRQLQRNFAAAVGHRMVRNKEVDVGEISKFLWREPLFPLAFADLIASRLGRPGAAEQA